MIKFLKKIFQTQLSQSENVSQASIQKLVSYNFLNKRKNLRIKYPHFGAVGNFPRVFYKDTEMIIVNVSVGGVMVIDDTERFGNEVGEVVMLNLVWEDFSTKVRARIVGANLQRRHLQFVDFNAQAFLRITNLSKPAYLGTRFHRVHDDVGQLQALELWVGPTNETLAFYSVGAFAELTINADKYSFYRGRVATSNKNNEPVHHSILCDIIVLLVNLPEPTQHIKELAEIIDSEVRSGKNVKPTGTYG